MIPINQGMGCYQLDTNPEGLLRDARATMALHAMHGGGAHSMPCCLHPWEIEPMIRAAMSAPPGCFVEVGVFWGGTAHHLTAAAKKQDRQIYLYDTFEGMPYMDAQDVNGVPVGVLKTDFAKVREFLGAYPHMYKCVFPVDVDLPPEPIAFAHIDVDAYRSTKETIEALAPGMALGGVMWFDDTNTLEGARQAVRELFPPSAIETDPVTARWFVRITI